MITTRPKLLSDDRTGHEILTDLGFIKKDNEYIREDDYAREVIDFSNSWGGSFYSYREYIGDEGFIEPLELEALAIKAVYLIFEERGRYDRKDPNDICNVIEDLTGVNARTRIVFKQKEETK